MIMVSPFFVILFYRFVTNNASSTRVTGAFILVSTFGMGAFFMQTIAVMDSFNMDWPPELQWLFAISKLFMFNLQGVSASCLWGNGFVAGYYSAISIPVVLFFAVTVGFYLTHTPCGEKVFKVQMKFNHTFSMVGMLSSALYITLVKVVLDFWECPENPCGKNTVAKYRQIVCYTDEHWQALPAMVIGAVLYVFGFYTYCMWAAIVAPTHWMDVGFRERFKFMFTRWRPDVWYWGQTVMTRNLLVAFAGLVSTQSRDQLSVVVVTVIVFYALTARQQPWRAPQLNDFDVATSFVLSIIGLYGMIFMSLGEEILLHRKQDKEIEALEAQQMMDAYAEVLKILIIVFLLLFAGVVAWCFNGMREKERVRIVQNNELYVRQIVADLKNALKDGQEGFMQQASALLMEATPYDRNAMRGFITKLMVDDKGSLSAGRGETASYQTAKDRAGKGGGKGKGGGESPAGTVDTVKRKGDEIVLAI